MREKTIVNAIQAQLRRCGWWVTKLHGGIYQRAGLPDLLAIKDGHTLFLEVKVPGGRPTALQWKTITELRSAGAAAYVVTSWEDVIQSFGFCGF